VTTETFEIVLVLNSTVDEMYELFFTVHPLSDRQSCLLIIDK